MGWAKERGIKAIAFDIDGTLYPRRYMYRSLFKAALRDIPFSVKYNSLRKKIRNSDGTGRFEITSSDDLFRREAEIAYGPGHYEKFLRKNSEQTERWKKSFSSVKPFKGMVEALTDAKKDFTLAVLTDFPPIGKLCALGIENLIDFVVSSEDSGALKPAAAPFLMLIDKLSVAPNEILFVGDSEDKDISGASALGMSTALIPPFGRMVYSKADVVFKTWNEFVERIL